MAKLQVIDDSNRADHFYLTPDDACYFVHEFTARQGYAYSPGNQFILNFKKCPSKVGTAQYQYKTQAIATAIRIYRGLFDQAPGLYESSTFVPIPPSKKRDHALYDDRMWQVVQGLCDGKNADAREFLIQTQSYDAAHSQGDGERIKPDALQALYQLDAVPPKQNVILFDDVLSAGCHFRAAKDAILERHPGVTVIGVFLARRVVPNPFEDLDAL